MLPLDGKWPRPTIPQRIGQVKVELGSGYVQYLLEGKEKRGAKNKTMISGGGEVERFWYMIVLTDLWRDKGLTDGKRYRPISVNEVAWYVSVYWNFFIAVL